MQFVKRFLKRYPHIRWALLVPVILLLFFLPEQLVVEHYTPTQIPLDGLIPFCPAFAVFYVLWYPMLAAAGILLLLRNAGAFRRYLIFLTLAYGLSAVIYLLWPNGQDLRPDLSQPGNVFEAFLAGLYRADTNTNVLPSLHVTGSMAILFGLWDEVSLRRSAVFPVAAVLAALVIASTVLVKQHAVLDVLAGLVFSILLWPAVYLPRKRDKKE